MARQTFREKQQDNDASTNGFTEMYEVHSSKPGENQDGQTTQELKLMMYENRTRSAKGQQE